MPKVEPLAAQSGFRQWHEDDDAPAFGAGARRLAGPERAEQ
jgi:hypothetical protein